MMKDLIKKSFSTGNYTESVSVALLVFRVVVSVLMLTHGLPKLKMLFAGGPIQFLDPIGLGPTLSLILVVLAEFLASILLILGLATRFSAVLLLITMLVAGFIFHASHPFSAKELAYLYSAVYFLIAFTGAGKYSADSLLSKKL